VTKKSLFQLKRRGRFTLDPAEIEKRESIARMREANLADQQKWNRDPATYSGFVQRMRHISNYGVSGGYLNAVAAARAVTRYQRAVARLGSGDASLIPGHIRRNAKQVRAEFASLGLVA